MGLWRNEQVVEAATPPIPPGVKEEGRMMNDEEASKATLKPHQCDIKATSKRVDSQLIGTPKPL